MKGGKRVIDGWSEDTYMLAAAPLSMSVVMHDVVDVRSCCRMRCGPRGMKKEEEETQAATRREMLLLSCYLAAGGMSRVGDRMVTSLLDIAPPENGSGERAGHEKGILRVLHDKSIAWRLETHQNRAVTREKQQNHGVHYSFNHMIQPFDSIELLAPLF